jgi:hypothetical protein
VIAQFDIFYVEPGGAARWIEAAESIESAKARIQKLAVEEPGDYLVVNRETREKSLIHPDAVHHSHGQESKASGATAWKKTSDDALAENEPHKFADKVAVAEEAILQRLREIRNSPNDDPERGMINIELKALLTEKNRKLNFPDWKT